MRTLNDQIKGSEINSAGYGTIAKLVMQDRELNIGAKAVYAYFCSYTGAGNSCFPSRDKICFDLNISKDTIGKHIAQLTLKGYIKVDQVKDKGRFSYNVYTILNEVSPVEVAPDPETPCPKISDTEKTGHGNTGHGNTGPGKLAPNNNSININSSYKNNNLKKNNPITAFDKFWEVYPKKVGKEAARKAFAKVKVPLETLIAAIEKQKKSKQWTKEKGQYIPHPATWLNQGRWEDELETCSQPSPGPTDYGDPMDFYK